MDGGAITGGMTDVGAMDTATIWAELLELGARVERWVEGLLERAGNDPAVAADLLVAETSVDGG